MRFWRERPDDTGASPERRKLVILIPMVSHYSAPWMKALEEYFDVTVIVSNDEGNRNWSSMDYASQLHIVRGRTITISRTLRDSNGAVSDLQYLQLNWDIVFQLFRLRPDHIITGEFGLRSLFALVYSGITRAGLLVMSSETTHSARNRSLFRQILRSQVFARLVPNWLASSTMARDYLLSIGVSPSRVSTLLPPTDTTLFACDGPAFPLRSERPRVLFVGQLIQRKGVDLLVESAVRLWKRGEDFSLVMAGDGPLRSSIERSVPTQFQQRLELISSVAPSQMASVYRACDALVFPTLEDVWGHVVPEALACCVPTFGSKFAASSSEFLPQTHVFDPHQPNHMDAVLLQAASGSRSFMKATLPWTPSYYAGRLSSIVKALSHD